MIKKIITSWRHLLDGNRTFGLNVLNNLLILLISIKRDGLYKIILFPRTLSTFVNFCKALINYNKTKIN